ncbi:MAG: PQQ-binding-like beta-propeller repeat protein [Calditrichia bacterium]|nr:PQQ-binding-like beta-propeller repeat protein [Calditrichia bacterium]
MLKNYFLIFLTLIFLFILQCKDSSGPEYKDVKIKWSYPVLEDYHFTETQPVIENGKTYAAYNDKIGCFKLSSGDKIWSVSNGFNKSLKSRKILHDDNYLYLNHLNVVKAINKNNGDTEWINYINNFSGVSLEIMEQNESFLFLAGRAEVAKIGKSDGSVEFRIQLDSLKPDGVIQRGKNPKISSENYLYVPVGYYIAENGYIEGNIFCYNAQTGEYIWGFHPPNQLYIYPDSQDSTYIDAGVSGCDISDSLVVFNAGPSIYALNRFTGEKTWVNHFMDGFWMGPVVSGDKLYIGSLQTYVYCLDLNTGNVLWKTYTGKNSLITILTIQDNRVYLSDDDYIWVINADNGKVIWSGCPPDNDGYASSLAVGEGYMVSVGHKKIYCLNTP